MQIQISGHHIELTDALRQYIHEKFERLSRHSDHLQDAHVVLEVEKLTQKAEAVIRMDGGTIFAEAESEDMYAAIDGLVDKLDRQLKRQKEKSTDYHRGKAS